MCLVLSMTNCPHAATRKGLTFPHPAHPSQTVFSFSSSSLPRAEGRDDDEAILGSVHPYPILIHLLICWLFQHPFSPRYSLAVYMCFCVDFVKGIIVKVILMYLYVSLFRAGQCIDLFRLLFFLTDFSYGLFGGVLCISNPPFMWFVG